VLSGLFALLRRHFRRPCLATTQPSASAQRYGSRVLADVLGDFLGLSRGKIDDQLAELVRIARALA
jgi:hypothetical protein